MVSKNNKISVPKLLSRKLKIFLDLIFLYLAPSKEIQIPESGKLFACGNQSPGLTSVAIVLESENNYYSCTSKLHV